MVCTPPSKAESCFYINILHANLRFNGNSQGPMCAARHPSTIWQGIQDDERREIEKGPQIRKRTSKPPESACSIDLPMDLYSQEDRPASTPAKLGPFPKASLDTSLLSLSLSQQASLHHFVCSAPLMRLHSVK